MGTCLLPRIVLKGQVYQCGPERKAKKHKTAQQKEAQQNCPSVGPCQGSVGAGHGDDASVRCDQVVATVMASGLPHGQRI